ncbi:hypothetical protein CAEBREN_23431 [Caenorhabditis brenneri]|uniref:Uncharacterized protein n=1 Tax=Caenorhabditis brenneri TaxID=135651 RepID=G0M757_CAEBE|nr:hypothetical protein CAEBREN_23431 [Caenorhabditis brenneri]
MIAQNGLVYYDASRMKKKTYDKALFVDNSGQSGHTSKNPRRPVYRESRYPSGPVSLRAPYLWRIVRRKKTEKKQKQKPTEKTKHKKKACELPELCCVIRHFFG